MVERSTEAERLIAAFEAYYGAAHLALAAHAAVPAFLTPRLLYRLRVNPLLGDSQRHYPPWHAVADLLLSDLCRELAPGVYEFVGEVRSVLLDRLERRHGPERVSAVGEFVLAHSADASHGLRPGLQQAQRWVALAYSRTEAAIEELAQRVHKLSGQVENHPRFTSIAALTAYVAPHIHRRTPASSPARLLLTYIAGMGHYQSGDLQQAAELFKQLRRHHQGSAGNVPRLALLVPSLPAKGESAGATVPPSGQPQAPASSANLAPAPPTSVFSAKSTAERDSAPLSEDDLQPSVMPAGPKFRNPRIVPSLVIGCGGMGVGTVRYLKRRVQQSYGERVPDLLQLYAFDTERTGSQNAPETLAASELSYTGGFEPQSLVARRDFVPWWDFDDLTMLDNVVESGTRMRRPLGRLACHYAFPLIWSNISAKLTQLEAALAPSPATYPLAVDASTRQVILVASLAGGTGSAAFLDLAIRLRRDGPPGLRIVAVLFLPSVIERNFMTERERERARGNSYAALLELEAIADPHLRQQMPLHLIGQRRPLIADAPPFDEVYLLGRHGRGATLPGPQEAAQHAAHGLFLLTAHSILDSDTAASEATYVQQYSSFGAGAVVLPQEQLSSVTRARLQSRVLERMLNAEQPNDGDVTDFEQTLEAFVEQLFEHGRSIALPILERDRSDPERYDRILEATLGARSEIARLTLRWLFGTIVPTYGLGAIDTVYRRLYRGYREFQRELASLRRKHDELARVPALNRLLRRRPTLRQLDELHYAAEECAIYAAMVPQIKGDERSSRERDEGLLGFVLRTLRPLDKARGRLILQIQQLLGELQAELRPTWSRSAATALAQARPISVSYPGEQAFDRFGDQGPLDALWTELIAAAEKQGLLGKGLLDPVVREAETGRVVPSPIVQLLGLRSQDQDAQAELRLAPPVELADYLRPDGELRLDEYSDLALNTLLRLFVEATVGSVLQQQANIARLLVQPSYANGPARQTLERPLRTSFERLLTRTQAYWGAEPFPEIWNVAASLGISLPTESISAASTLFANATSLAYTAVEGYSAFRVDALAVERGALRSQIGELLRCRESYARGQAPEGRASFHLAAHYADLLDEQYQVA